MLLDMHDALKTQIDNLKVNPPLYYIGVDSSGKDTFSYCLMREVNGVTEVVIAKTMQDEAAFNKEFNNLAEYFCATIYLS